MAVSAAASAVPSVPAGAAAVDTPAMRRAVAIAEPSVVFVLVRITGSLLDRRDGQLHRLVATSKGTGWFVDPDGALATATHVVAPNPEDTKVALVDRYIVSLTGSQQPVGSPGFATYMRTTAVRDVSFTTRVISQGTHVPPSATDGDLFALGRPARILSSSAETSTDISVLQVSGQNEPTVLIGSAVPPPIGVPLGIIGYPRMAPLFSVTPTVTYGPLTSIGHGSASTGLPTDATAANVAADATVLGTDAFAEHGDSGGPAVDEGARVVGLVSFGAVSGRPIFLVGAADIAASLRGAQQVNLLGPADRAWRAGLAAEAAGSLPAALADFRSCAAASPDNVGCSGGMRRVAAALAPQGGSPWVPLALAGLLALALLGTAATWLRRRATGA